MTICVCLLSVPQSVFLLGSKFSRTLSQISQTLYPQQPGSHVSHISDPLNASSCYKLTFMYFEKKKQIKAHPHEL